MKKSEMKEVIDSQRYFLVALQIYLLQNGLFPSPDGMLETNLDKLWETTSMIGESLNIDLVSMEEIIKTGKELIALKNMYSMDVNDKTSIN
jgi:hypothetical protein